MKTLIIKWHYSVACTQWWLIDGNESIIIDIISSNVWNGQ